MTGKKTDKATPKRKVGSKKRKEPAWCSKFLALVNEGKTERYACALCSIASNTPVNHAKRDLIFAHALTRAREHKRQGHLDTADDVLLDLARGGNIPAFKMWAAKNLPQDYKEWRTVIRKADPEEFRIEATGDGAVITMASMVYDSQNGGFGQYRTDPLAKEPVKAAAVPPAEEGAP